MIIGIDASRANKPHKTGVEWYSYHLIEEFKKLDHKNQYFLYTNKSLRGDLGKCPSNFRECLLKWPIPRSWTIGRLSWEMKFGKYRPDVLFVPAHTLPLLNPKKSIVTIHDIGFEHFPEAYHWADKLYHKLIIKIIKHSASKIITVSEFTKQDIIQTYKISAEKIFVVHNGYDNKKYKPCPNTREILKNKYQIDFPYILFVGRLELKKNIPRLVEAFGQFKLNHPETKIKLVLVGTKGLTFPLVWEQIEKYHLQEEIIFPGWISDEDLPLFHSNAEVFAFPSLFEGFGIPVLEAMACGCPVVCSNTTSLPEVAGKSALMFNPQKTTEITQALEKVIFNQGLKSQLIAEGLKRAREFSWERSARETLNILEK